MVCKHLGWLINQGYYWCNKDRNKNPFKDCENCPFKEEFELGEMYSSSIEETDDE